MNHGARDGERIDDGHFVTMELDVERNGHLESDGEVDTGDDEQQQSQSNADEFENKDQIDGHSDEKRGNKVQEVDREGRVGGADEIASNGEKARIPEH